MSQLEPNPSASVSQTPSIVLVGNPNTGKSTLFNGLCGTRQVVGNYPGVTVDKKYGWTQIEQKKIQVIDLPGLYSLRAHSPDEVIAQQVLLGQQEQTEDPRLIVLVMDATNLRRNLLLCSQIIELGKPVIIALTMVDLLTKQGIELDIPTLAKHLGVPVVPIAGQDQTGYQQLKTAIGEQCKNPTLPTPQTWSSQAIAETHLKWQAEKETALSLFEFTQALHQKETRQDSATQDLPSFWHQIQAGDIPTPQQLIGERYQWAGRIHAAVEKNAARKQVFDSKLDRLLTHRVFGLLIFAAVMYLVFQSIYTWAGPLMDLIDLGFGSMGDWASRAFEGMPMLQSLVVEGMIGGVGSVIIFLPQILILFGFVAILEDSGYLARVAFLMDKLMSWTGLNGRAFIPLLSGFACAIPAVMAARVMPDPKARLLTILIAPLMSCSARLPVYILLIGTFIEPEYGAGWAAFSLFAMHALGLFIAIPLAWIFNRGFLKSKGLPFILEMPPYRLPHWRNILFRAGEAGKKFTVQTGTIILALSIVIWALIYFPRPERIQQQVSAEYQAQEQQIQQANLSEVARNAQLEQMAEAQEQALSSAYLNQSILARIGKAAQPIFAPLGFDWKITVGILAAFPAREVIIATYGMILNLGDTDETSKDLQSQLKQEKHPDGRLVYSPLVAICLMIFFALCCQCMATLATIKRELNSWKWPIFTFTYMTGLAYVVTLLVYQGGKALGFA